LRAKAVVAGWKRLWHGSRDAQAYFDPWQIASWEIQAPYRGDAVRQMSMTQRLSAARLRRMHDVLGGFVDRGEMPGIVALVSRRDDLRVETIGALSFGGAPMRRDAIFRIRLSRIDGRSTEAPDTQLAGGSHAAVRR
jgi:hypothetical protein